MLHCLVVIALVSVADRDIGFDGFVAAAVVVVGVDVVDAVAGCAAVAAAVAIAAAAAAEVAIAAAAAGPVFVAQYQPPRKKIRRGQRSRYQTPENEDRNILRRFIRKIYVTVCKINYK